MATPKSGKTAPIILDVVQVEKLAAIGCTQAEMASFFDCSVDTLQRNYAAHIAKGRENGKVSLRRLMWDQGHKGNSTALKYLVHNVLKERIELDLSNDQEQTAQKEVMEKINAISTEMILKIVRDNDEKAS